MTFHKTISYVKSITRICGFLWLLWSIPWGVVVLIWAEILGIAEEGGDTL